MDTETKAYKDTYTAEMKFMGCTVGYSSLNHGSNED
jgi:hypothetical protein